MLPTQQQFTRWPFIGQETLGKYVLNGLKSKQLPRAILFSGPKGLGKASAAIWLSRLALCQSPSHGPCEQCVSCHQSASQAHPDQIIVEASDTDRIPIESVRQALRRFMVTGMPEQDRWLIITDADRLTESASNILLKFLEELPTYTRALFTTSRPDMVLPTLRSRLTTMYWHLVSPSVMRKTESITSEQAHRAAGRPGWLAFQDAQQATSSTDMYRLLQGETKESAHTETSTRFVEPQKSESGLQLEELVVRELLLHACGSQRRILWPQQRESFIGVAKQFGIQRLRNLVERYLDRHEYSLNIQPRLLYEDLHLV